MTESRDQGFRIFRANRIEQFLQAYPELFLPGNIVGPSKKLVIQNRNMGEWLKLKLADRLGISAGLEIFFPEQALRIYMDFFDHPFKEKRVLFMDSLKVVLFNKLRIFYKEKKEIYRPLTAYLSSGKGDGLELRLYQLADVLAGLFYHYGMNCIELTQSWDRGELFGAPLAPEHQVWQMSLWQELFNEGSSYIHPSKILTDISSEKRHYSGPKDHIQLFGSSFLGETGIRFFHTLSRFLPVDFYYVIPSSLFSQNPPDQSDKTQDPEWADWASMAKGLSDILHEFPPGEDLRPPEFPEHSLGLFQKSLWYNLNLPLPRAEKDKSIAIYSAPSERRQVEVLKDQVLGLLDQDKSLQLSDICIMAPDITQFAPHIERVFLHSGEQETHLPCHFIDLQGQNDASYTQGFLKLLELCGSRYTRPEIFSLFQNPCFARAASIDEGLYREWLELCEELNILWGMDGAHRESMGLGSEDTNTWEWGFRRILLGFYYGEERQHQSFPWTDGPESQQSDNGRFIALVRGLFADLEGVRKKTQPLALWVLSVEALMEKYLKPRPGEDQDDLDRLAVKAVFRNMNNMLEELGDLAQESCSWTFFYELLKESLQKTGRKKGHYLSQGISCSSLKPLRGIPFRVICLLGMDFGSFPGQEQFWNFDLRDRIRPAIDLSRRSSDRFSFLETLISARDRLWVFFKGRDQVKGDELLPSILVSEWMEMLSMEEKHIHRIPLHGHNPMHYQKESDLPSYDREAWLRALSLKGAEPIKQDPHRLSLNPEIPQEISFYDLAAFLRDPLQFYCREQLNLRLSSQGELLEENQEESYNIPYLVETGMLDDLLLPILQGQKLSRQEVLRELTGKGILSCSSWDKPALQKFDELLVDFHQSVDGYRDYLSSWKPVEMEWGGDTESFRNRQGLKLFPPLQVNTSQGPVRLVGSISGYQKEGGAHLELKYLYGSGFKARYAIPGFLNYLVLSLSGFGSQELLFAGRGEYPQKGWKEGLSGLDSGALLQTWVEAYLENRKNPLLLYPDHLDKVMDGGKKWEKITTPEQFDFLYRHKGSGSWGSPSDFEGSPYVQLLYPEKIPPLEREWDLVVKLYPWLTEFSPQGGEQ